MGRPQNTTPIIKASILNKTVQTHRPKASGCWASRARYRKKTTSTLRKGLGFKGPRTQTLLYFDPKVSYKDDFKTKVSNSWAHGPLGSSTILY